MAITDTRVLPAGYDPSKLKLASVNYGAAPVAPVGTVPTGEGQINLFSPNPTKKGFTTIDPTTGKTKMLPYTPGSGVGAFANAINDPTRVGSLLGVPGASTALDKINLGAAGGAGAGGGGGSAAGAPNLSVGAGGGLPTDLLGQAAGNLSSELKGELPQDVQDLLAQQAAEYGVGSGTQGSQFQGYRGLRNLGLTSLDLSKHATDLLAGQFMTPAQKAALDLDKAKLGESTREFGVTSSLAQKKLEQELALEKEKFAAEENRQRRLLQLQELQSLGTKYGGLGGYGSYGGYMPERNPLGFSALEPGASGYFRQ